MSANPHRAYCFTLNNPNEAQVANAANLITDNGLVRYAIWQLESGTQGTHHFQGYLELCKPARFTQVRDECGLEGAHFEPRQGSPDQARDYCRKLESRIGGPWEFGTWEKSQGKRSDLERVSEMLKSGALAAEIASECTSSYIRYHRGIAETRRILFPPAHRDPERPCRVTLLLGPSGCGKSSTIRRLAPPDAYWKDNGKWWDGYTGQSDVILDDMSGCTMAYGPWKRTLDRYPYTVEFKGGSCPLSATNFWLSSCSLPDKWWNKEVVRDYRFDEIARRITTVLAWSQQEKEFVTFESNDSGYALNHFLESPLNDNTYG